MSRRIVLVAMAVAVLLAGCQGEGAGGFAKEHERGLIGGAVGAGIGALAGRAVGRNTTSTLIGAAVGAGVGYLIGNSMDKKRAESYDRATPTELTGTKWHVEQLNTANPPAYRDMYLSFEPNSQLVTTQIMPDGKVVTAAETYRIADHTLIINRPAAGSEPGYVVNANYTMTGDKMAVRSPDFSVDLRRVDQIPAQTQPARTSPF